jgi:hypothetical protein
MGDLSRDQTVEWVGDKNRQLVIAKAIASQFGDTPAIDLAGACETIIVNLIIPLAKSRADALAGVEQAANDMRETIERCDKFRN